ncbi:MAG: DUF4411 family protein [Candidatus Liptonbacteria bacterium]|nr:DUF4411 family protein [Candidatus Liptonbacteria bacterium]
MPGDLFSKPAEYTIDSCSLMSIFSETPWISKSVNPGLWERIKELMAEGVIISHAEVLAEIKKDGKKGEELYNWAHANEHIFKNHDEDIEGKIIRSMSVTYKVFVNNKNKASDVYADPWLIAQAKLHKLKIISEETHSGSTDPENYKLPNVCDDPLFGVKCLNLWELVTERGWTFQSSRVAPSII